MKAIKILATVATFAFVYVPSFGVWTQAAMGNSVSPDAKVIKTADMTYGEVRKIDKEAGKITLKHGKIENLDMPGMTMVFKIKNKSQLDNIQVGDKVKFKAVKENGKFTVTDIKTDK